MSDPKPIQLLEIFKYFSKAIYKRKRLYLSNKMWLSAALLITMVSTLDSSWSLYVYWATMTHQVLEEYNSLPVTQTATKLLTLLNKHLLLVTHENCKYYSIQCEIKKKQFAHNHQPYCQKTLVSQITEKEKDFCIDLGLLRDHTPLQMHWASEGKTQQRWQVGQLR